MTRIVLGSALTLALALMALKARHDVAATRRQASALFRSLRGVT